MYSEIWEPTRSQFKTLIKKKPWLKHFDGISDPWTIGNLLIGEHDFKHFVEVFHDYSMEAPFHTEICQAWTNQDIRRLFIQMPRGHAKSTIGEIGVQHQGVYFPKKYTVVGAVTKDQVMERTENIRDLFDETYPFYYLAQDSNKNWGKTNFTLKNGARTRAVSSGGQIAGAKKGRERPSLFWGDDLVPNVVKTIKDYQINHWFFNDVLNLLSGLDPEAGTADRVVVSGTPYRETDLTMEITNNEGFNDPNDGKILKYEVFHGEDLPALWEDDTKVLWDYKFPLKELRKKYKDFGSLVFTRNYLCRFVSSELSLFPDELKLPALYPELRFPFRRPSYIKKVVGAADLAIDPKGDYYVIGAFGIHKTAPIKWELLALERWRGLNYMQQVKAIARLHERLKFDAFVVETNAFQRVISQLAKHLTSVPIKDHNTTFQKHDLEVGVPRLRTHFENERWVIPYGGEEEKLQVDALYHELTGTYIDEEGRVQHNTKHNDMVMWMYLVMNGLETYRKRVRLVEGRGL